MADPYLIRGRYVWMREMTVADTDYLVAWRNQPEIARFLIDDEPLTAARHNIWFARARARGDVLMMFDRPTGEPIGTASYYGFDSRRQVAELGRLCRGVERVTPWDMKESIYFIHRLVFEVLDLERSYFATSVENLAVQTLALKFFGYTQEGLLRQQLFTVEGRKDIVACGLLRDEYFRHRPSMDQALYGLDEPPTFTPAASEYADQLAARVRQSSSP